MRTCEAELIDSLIEDRSINIKLCSEALAQLEDPKFLKVCMSCIEDVRTATLQDAMFMFETDPASGSLSEILLCYPGIRALMYQRIAYHVHTHELSIPARLLTEYIHSETGIDIHPGTKIGHHIAIDHGTGIVIGETAIIGNYVRLYHNVSLGNLSVKKQQQGSKRHPTIEDHVTLYAGAIILGGETTIGHHSTIGGGAVVTSSVEPHSLVTTQYTTSYYDKRTKDEYAKEDIQER